MKKLVLSILVLSGSCFAMDSDISQAEESQFELCKVPHLSTDNMAAFQKQLKGRVRSGNTARALAWGAGALGGFYLLSRWFDTHANDAVTKGELATQVMPLVAQLEKDRNALQARVASLETGRPAGSTRWFTWFSDQATDFAKAAGNWLPGIVQGFIFHQVTGLVWKQLPAFGEYLEMTPTINWCLFKGTNFTEVLSQYINWYQSLIMNPHRGFNRNEFALCSHQLVTEVEKVVGYMGYVTSLIKPGMENAHILQERAKGSMDSIVEEMIEYVDISNEFLVDDNLTPDMIDGMMLFWQRKIFAILCHLENFEVVTQATGCDDPDDPPRFNKIKKFVAPKWERFAPEPQQPDPEEEMLKNLVSQVAQS